MRKPRLDPSFDERKIVLLRNPGILSEPAQDLLQAAREASAHIEKTLVAIESILGVPMHRITPLIEAYSTDHTALLDAIPSSLDAIRILFDEQFIRGNQAATSPPELDQSHVVFCVHVDGDPGWTSHPEPVSAYIECDWRHAAHLIHDVVSDIAVFRGIKRLQTEMIAEDWLAFLNNIDERKTTIVSETGYTAAYAPTWGGAGYVSLAAFSRIGTHAIGLTGDEVQRWACLWKKVFAPAGLKWPPHPSLVDFCKRRLAKCKGRLKGAVNPETFAQKLSALPPGNYEYWFTCARPHSHKTRDTLEQLFKKDEFCIGMDLFLDPKRELILRTTLSNYDAYVDWFPISRPDLPLDGDA